MNDRKIVVFGATGSVGRKIIEQVLASAQQVTTFSRTPEKMALQHPNLSVVAGSVLDEKQVHDAIAGHDAVLCAIGAGRHGHVREAATRNIVKGMQSNKVKRLICQTTLGAGDSYGNLNFFWKYIMFATILRPVLVDHNKQESVVMDSDLDWTLVRPAAFTDGPVTKKYQYGFQADATNLTFKISRSDVADFMLSQIGSNVFRQQAVGLSY